MVRTLVVDDVADMRRLLVTILSLASDFVVIGTAADGAEAVSMTTLLKPDLILLDVMMPVMDGIEALPLLREECPKAKIVALTALAAPERDDVTATAEALLSGQGADLPPADAVLSKATLPYRLLDRLREVMAQ